MCGQAQYTALAAAWAQHLKAKGWFNQAIVYGLDEPTGCTMAPCDSVYAKMAQASS